RARGAGRSRPQTWPCQRLPGHSEPERICIRGLIAPPSRSLAMNRREFLWHSGGGLGGVALASLLGSDGLLAAEPRRSAGLRPDGGLHHAPKARRVIQLFMAGAASHIDLFDFKPELIKRHGRPSDFGERVETFQNGLGPWLRPVFDFKPYGSCDK